MEDECGGHWEWYIEKKNDPQCVKNWGHYGNREQMRHLKFMLEWQRDMKENPDRIITVKNDKSKKKLRPLTGR